ncbi:hypothetical protein D3C74_295850 [compost metagenome]
MHTLNGSRLQMMRLDGLRCDMHGFHCPFCQRSVLYCTRCQVPGVYRLRGQMWRADTAFCEIRRLHRVCRQLFRGDAFCLKRTTGYAIWSQMACKHRRSLQMGRGDRFPGEMIGLDSFFCQMFGLHRFVCNVPRLDRVGRQLGGSHALIRQFVGRNGLILQSIGRYRL